MSKQFMRAVLAAATVLVGTHSSAHAANWLMLQGTEPAGTAKGVEVWGFVQVDYQVDTSDPNATGGYVPPKLLGPDLTSQKAFNVSRARLGARGLALPLDDKVNYFFLVEAGNNAITYNSSSVKLTDASITLNHIPGARVRAGLFKYPTAEEAFQAIHVMDYINFTEVTNQMMLERFPNKTYPSAGNVAPCDPQVATDCNLNGFDRPVGAFRDVGLQIFDAFTFGSWDTSYAVMVGNGNGLNYTDNDSDKDFYGYLSTEWVFGGEGPFREGLKFFAWGQTGKRHFDGNNDGRFEEYARDRTGLGVKYLQKPFRATAEYMWGKGMIWNGPDKPTWALTTGSGNPEASDNGLKAKATGWYAEGGWYLPGTDFEFDLRYDFYARLDGARQQLDWKTWTAGIQYHINRKTRLAFNYSMRDINAPNYGPAGTSGAPGPNPNDNLDGIKDRYGVQLTAIF